MILHWVTLILEVLAAVAHIWWCHLLGRHRWRFDGWYYMGIKVDRLKFHRTAWKHFQMVDVCERCGCGRIIENKSPKEKEHSHG